MTALNVQKLANKMCRFLCKEYGIEDTFKLPSIKVMKDTVIGKHHQINPRIAEKYLSDTNVAALYNADNNLIMILGPSKGFYYTFESNDYAKNSRIGAVYSTNPNVRMIVDLAHEIAHWFQYQNTGNLTHGRKWRESYGLLRDEFVNHRKNVLFGSDAIRKDAMKK